MSAVSWGPLRGADGAREVFEQIDRVFGQQSHPDADLMAELARLHPPLLWQAHRGEKLLGHAWTLPFTDAGREFILHPDFPEADMGPSHLALHPDPAEKIHFFVYSLLSEEATLSFPMVAAVLRGMGTLLPRCHPDSTLFAEVVSGDGLSMCRKMGLSFHHRYQFQGELEVSIHEARAQEAFARWAPWERLGARRFPVPGESALSV